MKFYISLLTTFLFSIANSQIIFFEDFDESANSTTGTDSTNINWNTLTPYSIASSDYFKVVNNKLEAKDTNGPATFETDDISVLCGIDVLVSMDLTETGTMEGSGCSVDYVKFEYSWDSGTTWKSAGDNTYGITTDDVIVTGCSGWISTDTVKGPLLTIDDFTSFSPMICLNNESSSLRIKITIMNTAGSEKHRVDNLKVECSSCNSILPVELISFDGYEYNGNAIIEWVTATEINNDKFELYHSTNAVNWHLINTQLGNGNSNQINKYNVLHPLTNVTNYYILKQIDYNGDYEYSDIIHINVPHIESYEYEYYNILGQPVPETYEGFKVTRLKLQK